jgi:hypothetical protein
MIKLNLVATTGKPVEKEAMDTCLLLTVLTISASGTHFIATVEAIIGNVNHLSKTAN